MDMKYPRLQTLENGYSHNCLQKMQCQKFRTNKFIDDPSHQDCLSKLNITKYLKIRMLIHKI